MLKILELVRKDFLIDWRQQNPLSSILLYLASTVFTAYMAFKGFVSVEIWNALLWIILLFVAIHATSKSFSQEERRIHYYFFLVKPLDLLASKLIYSFLYLLALCLATILLYSIFFGFPQANYFLFGTNLLLGCLGMSSAFTMVSAIAFRTNNRSIMMAVLGFPIIIPILILGVSSSFSILDGYILSQVQGNMISLFSLDVIIIALAFILFPFIWKS